jgi:acetyl esterase/lipase
VRAGGVAVTDCHYPDQIHGFAFMPAVIPAANDAIMEIAGLLGIQLDPA